MFELFFSVLVCISKGQGQNIQETLYTYLYNGLPKKSPSSQGYGFLSVMYGCESWTIKKAEHRRIDAFELWCWRTL